MTHAVYVASWGAATGFGVGRATLLEGIWSGRSAIVARRRTAGGPVPTAAAAEVPELARVHEQDRAFHIARLAAREALVSAENAAQTTLPLVVASTKGELTGIGFGPTADTGLGLGSPARLARRLAVDLESPTVLAAVSCACASGVLAIALAARRIERGEVERVLVIGVDVLDEFVLAGFGGLGALDPGPCRPFDRARRGVSLGDGAAAVILTKYASESIGVRITGRGAANDVCHVTGPDREGLGLALAGRRALAMAAIEPRAIDLVHVHGTGTVANDACEARGLALIFGGQTAPAFGTKAQTGHTLGAAGVLETCLLAEALLRGESPANVGLEDPDVDERVDLVRERRRLSTTSPNRVGLKLSSGFGGIVGALVLST